MSQLRYKQFISFILIFWAGFVSAISFMEAWLKFQAEGVSREIGLSIGKLVFTALNRVEIVLLVSVWIIHIIQKKIQNPAVKCQQSNDLVYNGNSRYPDFLVVT